MADMTAPSGQAPAVAPPVHEEIVPRIKWVQIGKSNCYLYLDKKQSNPILKMAVDLLMHTNFHGAFTASSTIPSIYIQQFWDMIQYDKKLEATGVSWMNSEFTQSIHTFIEDKRNLSRHRTGKKRATLIVIPSIRFTKLIIHHLQRRHKFHPRLDSLLHLPNDKPAIGYLKFNAKVLREKSSGCLFLLVSLLQTSEKLPTTRNIRQMWLSIEGFWPVKQGVLRTRLHQSPLSPPGSPSQQHIKLLQGLQSQLRLHRHNLNPHQHQANHKKRSTRKGKAKVTKEQVAHDLLSLQKAKRKSPVEQYIFQRRTFTTTGSSRLNEPSHAEPEWSESETMEKVVPEADKTGQGKSEGQARPDPGAQAEGQIGSDVGAQDETSEGQAGSDPDEASEGQARPDPGNARGEMQSIPGHVVHAGSDREHMDLDAADVPPQPSQEQLDEGFTATVYPKVQDNLKLTDLFFNDKPSEVDNDTTTAKIKVESMVSVTIQQDMSTPPPLMWTIPHMTSPIVDLTLRHESPKAQQQFKATTTKTTTTTTTTLPPLTDQQQSTTEAMMMKRIGELEHIMADLLKVLKVNKEIEERLDSHGARLYTLEQLDILQQVSKAVSEVVIDAVDWAMQAPLRNCFRDLPEANIKDILHQCMWETESYKSHKDHMQIEKSMYRDHFEELAQDLVEARKRKKKSRESPKMPPGYPPHQLPPLPPPVGPSGASRALGAWTTTDARLRPSISLTHADLVLDEDMGPDEQAPLLDEEDIGSAHIPKVNLRQDWWKPLEEERPATPKPAWSIPSSDVPVSPNNWALALASNYSPPPEDSLLVQTGEIATFIDWFCKRGGITELKPQDLEGPAFEIVKIALHRADPNEHVIAERDFKYLYPSDFEDLYLLNLQGHLDHLPPKDKKILTTAVNQWTRHLHIDEALDYRVKEFRINRMNPGLNTRFWTKKDVDRSRAFMFAIQKHLKTRRIFRNLESFVGGCLREGDYRLLKRTE
nr:hypothetical protein [Tanacetum cinerariifolium]